MNEPKDNPRSPCPPAVASSGTPVAPSPSANRTCDSSAGPGTAASFPIVGLGASAGGLEVLRQLFAHLPTDTGMAFVVIQHLDPDRPSKLASVLIGMTQLPVVEVASGMRAEPGRVHVIPSGSDLGIRQGILTLVPRQKTGKLHLPIDSFFRALAEDQHFRAIGVVLSGSGADGTEGLRAIKANGGIAIAQDPESAQFRSMPESALAAGVVDFCASAEEIARELGRLGRHPYVAEAAVAESEAEGVRPDEERNLAPVLALVRKQAGMDFGGYKHTTVRRRVERRMALRRVDTLSDYASVLRTDPAEARALARDMLIHVTSFFRDPEAFEALNQHVLQGFLHHRDDASIRIWVPGCSTGEEVYAIAICLLESLGDEAHRFSIKIFGSDVSDEAIQAARIGLYAESALVDVSQERLSRFFERAEGGYRIGRRIRDFCVFVTHDLTRDPPFAKLDLISCRNLLIYFDAVLQRRVIPMLHYCLLKPGYLFLGHSETITGFQDLFAPLDEHHRIFIKTGESSRVAYPLETGRTATATVSRHAPAERVQPARDALRQADHLLLSRFAPPGVVVNERLEIIQFRGHTGAFLESPPGLPEANVLRMAREGLAAHLHEALERAKEQSITVRHQGLRLETVDGPRVVDIEVIPLAGPSDSSERFFLILFQEAGPPARADADSTAAPPEPPAREGEEARWLRAELVATKDYLQSVIGEHQSTANELAAANEELIAANEELQSANEELQSAKEELQSTNEELNTLNDELRSRNAALDQIANDLENVLASVEIPIIIVDLGLRVRRFTPTIRDIANLIPEDVGRPIDDLKFKVEVHDLPERVREVIHALALKDWEIQRQDGRWFRMQIRPYRTIDNRLDGAVLSFVDIDILKHALKDAEGARDYARGIVETVTTPLVVLDTGLRVVSANHAFFETFALSAEAAEGQVFFEVGRGMWDVPAVRGALTEASTRHTRFADLEVRGEFPRIGRKVLSLTGRPMLLGGGVPMILLAIDDITNLRALEDERAHLLESETRARLEAERANRAKDLFLATLSHELRTPLSTMLMQSQILKRMAADDPRLERASAVIERSVITQTRLIDDLLDVSRIVSEKLVLDLGAVDLKGVVREAVDVARPAAESKSLEFEVVIDDSVGLVYGDAARLQQVVSNLLTNAIKFTPRGGRIALRLERLDGRAQITIVDTGMGIRPELLPRLFTRFVQIDSSATRTHGGLGLGLAIVRHLVEAHGGEVHAESPGEGKGATFRVTLPLGAAAALPLDSTPPLHARDISGVRVLLIEDEDDARDSFSTMLEDLGAEVRAVPSAAAGLAALEEFRPQVILCDIAMPGEDGYSFIQKLRRLGPMRGGQVPAAALTALASEEDRTRALQAGFQIHMAKPVDAASLAAAVEMLAAWEPGANRPEQQAPSGIG